MHAHTGVFGPAVRTNASRLGREVRNGGYPVWAICRLQAVLFYIFNRFDDIKLLVRRQPTEIGEKPIPHMIRCILWSIFMIFCGGTV